MAKISSLSTEYVKSRARAYRDGSLINPTTFPVKFAFVSVGSEPSSSDWVDGTWEESVDGQFYARCLVGPTGTIALTDGTYDVWVKVEYADEVPVREIDKLVVT